jgi:hypothetical protein
MRIDTSFMATCAAQAAEHRERGHEGAKADRFYLLAAPARTGWITDDAVLLEQQGVHVQQQQAAVASNPKAAL